VQTLIKSKAITKFQIKIKKSIYFQEQHTTVKTIIKLKSITKFQIKIEKFNLFSGTTYNCEDNNKIKISN